MKNNMIDYINMYFKYSKEDKNLSIEYWKKLKKIKCNYFELGFVYLIKYIYIMAKEEIRYFLHCCKAYLKYLITSIKFKKIKLRKYNILDDTSTVDKIVNEGYSICRYGDGEFKWIFGIKQNSFQQDSSQMAKELKEIITNYTNDEKILIGINDSMNDLSMYNMDAKMYWKEYLIDMYKKLYELIPDKIFCSTNITRPYIDYKNKDKKIIQARFDNLKRIWDKRDVIIVEGEFTKLGVGNDLFDNCNSIKRILCPATNAYEKKQEILKEVKKQSKDKLILLSLGPTATILSYELFKEGYQCVDTGHVDIEYMWFLNGAKSKEEVEGKFVNEVSKKVNNLENTDKVYINQIIKKI